MVQEECYDPYKVQNGHDLAPELIHALPADTSGGCRSKVKSLELELLQLCAFSQGHDVPDA